MAKKPTAAQIRFLNALSRCEAGQSTAIPVTTYMTERACRAAGWVVATQRWPWHQITALGRAALTPGQSILKQMQESGE